MKKIAIIPLRKGSKGIKNKNKIRILGRPLFQWVLGEAIMSKLDKIYVFSDDEDILNFIQDEYKWTNKVIGYKRSEESSGDQSSTEFGMIELAQHLDYNFDIYCLLQATSPLTTSSDINSGIKKVEDNKSDSSLSVTESKRFFWNRDGTTINYNYNNRPRRQDFEGVLVENGAIYCINRDSFINNKSRLGGKIGLNVMPEDTYFEIDESSDILIVENLLKNRLHKFKMNPKSIKAMVFDIDGVFTDGKVAYSREGEHTKTFSLRDGMGFELLAEKEIIPIVITSEQNYLVDNRFKKLNIKNIFTGVKDKFSFLSYIINEMGIQRNQLAYVGDDINDLANMLSVGWAICPNDADTRVRSISDIILNNKGGNHALREAIEICIKINNKY